LIYVILGIIVLAKNITGKNESSRKPFKIRHSRKPSYCPKTGVERIEKPLK